MNIAAESTSPATGERDHVASLARGLGVMEILAAHPAGLTLTETAQKAGLTRAGARRFLLTLVASGYATREGRRFVLSARLLSLARTWLGEASPWTCAEPILREVSATLGESCSIAVLEGEDVVYVARVAGRRIVSVALHVGTRLPAHCTSMGRVLLSGLAPAALDAYLDRAAIHSRTPKTIVDRDRLRAEIAKAAREGHALVDQELELGLRSIAVPVRDRGGQVVAAVNVSTQSARHSTAALRATVLPHLEKAAARVEDFFALQ